tara:strand:- start:23 stop:328 length:306 start_codon:yes stop_codon:yes gene_type:complete
MPNKHQIKLFRDILDEISQKKKQINFDSYAAREDIATEIINELQKRKCQINTIKRDKCILCNIETEYDEFDHIDSRLFYEEGVGQLCPDCWNETYEQKNAK